jgi:hypothetical protein
MALSLFQSTTDPSVYAFTANPFVRNLPDDFGPWRPIDLAGLTDGGMLAGLAASNAVGEVVVRKGVYLARVLPPVSPFPPGENW